MTSDKIIVLTTLLFSCADDRPGAADGVWGRAAE